jgi:hypothetical protein
MSLPLSAAAFNADKQTKFKDAIATATGAGVTRDDVKIDKIQEFKSSTSRWSPTYVAPLRL